MRLQISLSILALVLPHLTLAAHQIPRQVSPTPAPSPSSSSSTIPSTPPTTTAVAATATACLCTSEQSGSYCGMRVIYGNSKHKVLDGKCDDTTLYTCQLGSGTGIVGVGNGDIGYNPSSARDCGNTGCYFDGGKNAGGSDGCNDDRIPEANCPPAST